MSFNRAEIDHVEIFPPINIARVGDSVDDYYMGPEIPGVEPMPQGGYRDGQQKIKGQAARFRVYAFNAAGEVLGELVGNGQYTLTWTVHVANKKSAWVNFRGQYREETWRLRNGNVQGWPSEDYEKNYAYTDTRDKLIIDSGRQSIQGVLAQKVPLRGQFYGSQTTPTNVHMGDIFTDDRARLVVLGSDGKSFRIDKPNVDPIEQPDLHDTFNNDDWVDSLCDGKVEVTVTSRDASDFKLEARNKATIITAPPKFTPGLRCPTSLYDLIEDIYERQARARGSYDVGQVNFHEHILPIFQNLYSLSWTNIRANEGHGPRRASYWLNNPELSDPTSPGKTREYIFGRVRAPVQKNDDENLKLRTAQAQAFYMPRLAGDNGDNPEYYGADNDANRWTSLTQLQYDRLAKWAKGEFVTGEPIVPPQSFDSIDPKDQPHALTQSALEWSVGAPLYPGIEAYWAAEFDDKYNPDARFRFSDNVHPGDLGKGLALPWQADFFMCNTHWWPSVRPDHIITAEDFEQALQQFQEQPVKIALNLTKRTRWDDGLNRDPGVTPDELPGCADMVRKWNLLGFIAKQEYGSGSELPIYVERDRHPEFPHTDGTIPV